MRFEIFSLPAFRCARSPQCFQFPKRRLEISRIESRGRTLRKYIIHMLGTEGSKARLRTALKLLGFEQVRITEAEQDSTAPAPRPDNLPTSPEAKAVADLYLRPHERAWSEVEITEFRKAIKRGAITLEIMKTISAHYDRERKKPDHCCRRDLLTFLRHVDGEHDRARAAKPTRGKALEWTPANVVEMPQDPAEQDRIRAVAAAGLRETRAKIGGNGV